MSDNPAKSAADADQFAVLFDGGWEVARVAAGADYGLEEDDAKCWSRVGDTAFLGLVGEEALCVNLDVAADPHAQAAVRDQRAARLLRAESDFLRTFGEMLPTTGLHIGKSAELTNDTLRAMFNWVLARVGLTAEDNASASEAAGILRHCRGFVRANTEGTTTAESTERGAEAFVPNSAELFEVGTAALRKCEDCGQRIRDLGEHECEP